LSSPGSCARLTRIKQASVFSHITLLLLEIKRKEKVQRANSSRNLFHRTESIPRSVGAFRLARGLQQIGRDTYKNGQTSRPYPSAVCFVLPPFDIERNPCAQHPHRGSGIL